jgi:hypothetical protein
LIINLRYHIASLVAVFLALGIGILIGSTLPGNEALIKQQKQLTDRLEVQLETLQKRNEAVQVRASSLEMDNNIQRQFEEQIVPSLIAGKLEGHNIAIIETNGYGFPENLVHTLQASGASVQSVITIINGLEIRDKSSLLTALSWPDMKDEEIAPRLAAEIAKAAAEGDSNKVLAALVRLEMITTQGTYDAPLSDVVIVGGSVDQSMIKTGSIDIPVINYFQGRKINVFGVEQSGALYSYMEEYQKKRISTVDNIESVPGQVALVLAISGKPGHYGIKSTAQKLLPAVDDAKGEVSGGQAVKAGVGANTRT